MPGEEGIDSLERAERERTDSQGSDDGSSSEGDPTPLSSADPTRADSYLVVTESNTAQQSAANLTEVDSVSLPYLELTPSTVFCIYLFSCVEEQLVYARCVTLYSRRTAVTV